MATPQQKELPVIPAGFKPMETSNFAPTHDFKKESVCTGKVQGIKKIPTPKNNKKETRVMVIETASGPRAVWESKALEDLFDTAKPGHTVWIRYDGPIKVAGRKKPMHGYTVAVKA